MAERRAKPNATRTALSGGGPSSVGIVGSMRARDVARPTDADIAAAEARVVIRRVPADQPFKKKRDEPRTP